MSRLLVALAAGTLTVVVAGAAVGQWTPNGAPETLGIPSPSPAASVPAPTTAPSVPVSSGWSVAPTSTVAIRTATLAPPRADDPPLRLQIPRLSADLPVVPVGVTERGVMEIPSSPWQSGWYRFGSTPQASGATVLATHISSRREGRGPFARVAALRAGDPVRVLTRDKVWRYVVTSVQRISKAEIELDRYFDPGGVRRLHLITCGGEFDPVSGHYRDNIVVVATPLDT